MTLTEYVAFMLDLIVTFEHAYQDGAKVDPVGYPAEQNEQGWFNQLDAYKRLQEVEA